jgi:histidinol-phosphate aminotransferase
MPKDETTGPRPYQQGRSLTVVPRFDGIDLARSVKLHANECVLGPAPGVPEAAAAAALTAHIYADVTCAALRAAIADRHGIDAGRIVCGNGSEELLDLVGRAYARPGDEILFPAHSFLQFAIVAWRVGATAVEAPVGPGFAVDVDALLAAVTPRTRVVFLANPNNPTGVEVPAAEVLRLADGLPGDVLLVLDGAYTEFAAPETGEGALALAAERPNVLVTRTFSKAYGMAALRLGWAFGPAAVIRALDTLRGIGNVGGPAQAAGIAAMAAQGHVARVAAHAAEARAFLGARLAAAGFEVVPTAANFVFARLPEGCGVTGEAAVRALAGAGVLVRANADYGLADWLRITVGHRADMERVAELLAALVARRA